MQRPKAEQRPRPSSGHGPGEGGKAGCRQRKPTPCSSPEEGGPQGAEKEGKVDAVALQGGYQSCHLDIKGEGPSTRVTAPYAYFRAFIMPARHFQASRL